MKPKRKMKMPNSSFRAFQKGQAAVEYLLLLFVILALSIGIVSKFSASFRSFAQSYLIDYVECLLQNAELPTLGFSGPSASSVCEGAYEPFSLRLGRPAVSSSSGNSVSSNSSATNQSSSTSKNSGGSSPANSTSSSNSSGTSESNSFASSPRGGAYANSGGSKGSSRSVPLTSADSSSESRSSNGRPQGFDSITQIQKSSVLVGPQSNKTRFVEANEASSAEKSLRPQTITSQIEKEDGARRVPANTEIKKKSNLESEDDGFTLPDFLRYLLIIAIIIALVIFFGGQAAQVSKSQQK
jgi:hypothetical protein